MIEKILATKREIETARNYYQTDDVEIDDNALISPNDEGGRWVAAWVWVSDEMMEEQNEKEERQT